MAGLSNIASGFWDGYDRQNAINRQNDLDAEAKGERERQRARQDESDARNRVLWGRQDTEWQQGQDDRAAEAPIVELERKGRIAAGEWNVAHGNDVRDTALEGQKLGVASTRQNMSIAANRERREADSHRTSQEERKLRIAEIHRILEAQKRTNEFAQRFMPLYQTDPVAAGKMLQDLVNNDPHSGNTKVGFGYDPERGTYRVARSGSDKSTAREMRPEELFQMASNVLDPIGAYAGINEGVAKRAAEYKESEQGRQEWIREMVTNDIKGGESAAGGQAKDLDGDNEISEEERVESLTNFWSLASNRFFPGLRPIDPPEKKAAPSAAPQKRTAGVSKSDIPFITPGDSESMKIKPGYKLHGRAPDGRLVYIAANGQTFTE